MRKKRLRPDVKVRTVEPHEWPRLRALRLRALASDPRAFGASLAEEAELPDAEWQARAAQPEERPFFVAQDEAGDWLGLIGGRAHEDGSHELVAMWVAPEARGRQAGERLVQAGIMWAKERKADHVHLYVVVPNERARALYARCGFVPVGEPMQGRKDPTRWFQRMDRPLQ